MICTICGDHFCRAIFRLLDVLAARKDPTGLSGEVLLDGAPQPSNFKCLSGYVVQVQKNHTSSTGKKKKSLNRDELYLTFLMMRLHLNKSK